MRLGAPRAGAARRSARVRGGAARRDGADRLLRRALDGGDLYDRRAGHAGPGAGAAVRLSHPDAFAALIDRLVAGLGRLSLRARSRPAPMRCRSSTAGRACSPTDEFDRWCIAPIAAIVARPRSAIPDAPHHRLSARRRAQLCELCRRRRGGRRASALDWTVAAALAARALHPDGCRCRAISIRCVLVAGGAALDDGIDAYPDGARRRAA